MSEAKVSEGKTGEVKTGEVKTGEAKIGGAGPLFGRAAVVDAMGEHPAVKAILAWNHAGNCCAEDRRNSSWSGRGPGG